MSGCTFVCFFVFLFFLIEKIHLSVHAQIINPRTYKQSHTPTVVQGGGDRLMEPLLWVFAVLQQFGEIFAFGRKPLMCSTR